MKSWLPITKKLSLKDLGEKSRRLAQLNVLVTSSIAATMMEGLCCTSTFLFIKRQPFHVYALHFLALEHILNLNMQPKVRVQNLFALSWRQDYYGNSFRLSKEQLYQFCPKNGGRIRGRKEGEALHNLSIYVFTPISSMSMVLGHLKQFCYFPIILLMCCNK